MTDSVQHIPDSGTSFLLTAPANEDIEPLDLGLTIRACDAPRRECPCTDTTIVLRRASELEGSEHEARVAFDIETREVAIRADPTGLLTGRAAWLQELFQSDFGRLAAARVHRRKLSPDAYRDVDWSRYHRGDLIPFHEAYPREFDLMVYLDRRRYWLCDEYCVAPRCGCQEAAIQVLDVAGGNEGVLRLDLAQQVVAGAPSELARRVCEAALAQHGWEGLRARRAKMRKIAKHIAPQMQSNQAPVQAQPRPGRNDPCPCGSGKKHKKCCAAQGAGQTTV